MRDETVSRVELGGDKSDHDETIWGVDETNLLATRQIGPIHDEMMWEVDETNSVHNETNWNNDSTTRNANLSLGSDFIVTLMEFTGNQRQFEHNAQINSIFDRLTSANVPD